MWLDIDNWEWDQGNIDKLEKRGITPEKVEEEIWLEAPVFLPNRKGRAATHLMIGPDRGGAMYTLCILQVNDEPPTWRVASGWPSKPYEVAKYRRAR